MSVQTLLKEIKSGLAEGQSDVREEEVGTVTEVSDGIARISGLSTIESLEMIEFSGGQKGLALNLEVESVGAIIMNDADSIEEGDTAKRTKDILSIPVSSGLTGRIVNPLGEAVDGKGAIQADERYLLERKAPGVMAREPVTEPVETGIKSIDAMIPIGRGQRELIIGDRQTGKTTVAIDAILNQKGKNMQCVYVAIGQKKSNIARVVNTLEEHGAMEYTTIVLAGASDGAALQYLAPYAGVAVAEFFMDQGKDVLVVYDDLSKHANAYREISLLLRRPPGREAYPGDVFYLHSRLLERAARRNEEHGGGSITALPIIETQAGDISSYIPTNIISITDGQIFLESGLFYRGVRPAINVGLSVSRVGGAAQIKSMKKVAGRMKLDLAQFRELEAFAQFASDLDEDTKKVLARGERLTALLTQPPNQPVRAGVQVALVFAANEGALDDVSVEDVRGFEENFTAFLESSHSDLLDKIESDWNEEIQKELAGALEDFQSTRA